MKQVVVRPAVERGDWSRLEKVDDVLKEGRFSTYLTLLTNNPCKEKYVPLLMRIRRLWVPQISVRVPRLVSRVEVTCFPKDRAFEHFQSPQSLPACHLEKTNVIRVSIRI